MNNNQMFCLDQDTGNVEPWNYSDFVVTCDGENANYEADTTKYLDIYVGY